MGIQVEVGPPQRERSRGIIEREAEFVQFREKFPLQARLILAFFSFADDALEAMSVRRDVPLAQESVAKMEELFTWLKNTSAPRVDGQLSELFGKLIKAGMAMEEVSGILHERSKKGKGAPVSNRLPVLLAYEQRSLNSKMSWMKLAVKFCQCSEPKHDHRCRERIRQQAMELEKMLTRLGV